MKYLVSAAIVLVLAGCNAESNAATSATQDVPQIVGNTGQPAGAAGMPADNPMASMGAQLAESGGGAHAAVELCGLDEDVAAAKREQQQQFVQMGGTAEQFEASYKAGYDRAQADFQAASAADRKQMCDSYREFGAQLLEAMQSGDW